MSLFGMVELNDGKFIRAYWQKTKNDSENMGIVSNGEKKFIRCSYTNQYEVEKLGDISLGVDGKVLDLVTGYDIRIGDWIYLQGKKYTISDITKKIPHQESNQFMKTTIVYDWTIVIK